MLFANSLLAIGASPIMARTEEEVEEGSNAGRFLRLI
jgi:hydroxyethylthiazole kinase-like sugar kinase family protein